MNKHVAQVAMFHNKMGFDFSVVTEAAIEDRLTLMLEELHEYADAAKYGGKAEVLDALVDLAYVLYGTVLMHGFENVFDAAFNRVHHANMQKQKGTNPKRPGLTQDVIKPAGWTAPDLEDLVS